MSILSRLFPKTPDAVSPVVDRAAEARELFELDAERAEVNELMTREASEQREVDRARAAHDAAAAKLAATRLELTRRRASISRRETSARCQLAKSADPLFDHTIEELTELRANLAKQFEYAGEQRGDAFRGVFATTVCLNNSEVTAKAEAINAAIRKLVDAKSGTNDDAQAVVDAVMVELQDAFADAEAVLA